MAKKIIKPIHIRELRLQNFKSFKDFKIVFDNFDILVGVNNSGKSTVLQGIMACYNFLAEMNRAKSRIKRNDSKLLPNLFGINIFDYRDAWYGKKMRSAGHTYIPVIFTIKFSNDLEIEFHLLERYGQLNVKIANCSREVARNEITQILSGNPHLIQGFVGVLPNEEFKTVYGLNRSISGGRHSEVLRNALLYLKNQDPKKFKTLNDLIFKYFHVKLIKNTINPRFQENVTALFQDKDADLDISLGGSGFLQILQMLTFIQITGSKIVLLDEPDAHLHPSLQDGLIQMLNELSTVLNIQFIISTHSKEIVTHTDPQHILHIFSENKEARRLTTDPEIIRLLDELGAIDNIDLALLMKTKKCLFVEGNEDKLIKIIANILKIDVFQMNSQIIPVNRKGVTNNRYYDDLTIFRNFIGEDLKAYSIIDRDVKTEGRINDIVEKSSAKGVQTHVWKKHEIENYLLVPSLLERVFNTNLVNRGSSDKISGFKEIIEECTNELKQDLTDQVAEELVHWNRSVGTSLDISSANKEARQIVESKWSNLNDRISILPGKELLSKINKKIQDKYAVSTNPIQLASQITRAEIDSELVEVMTAISTM